MHGHPDLIIRRLSLFNIFAQNSKNKVMGHGLDGAMISVFIKEAIDSYVALKALTGEELYPKKILQHLSSQYHRGNFPEDQFICIFLGVVDIGYRNNKNIN